MADRRWRQKLPAAFVGAPGRTLSAAGLFQQRPSSVASFSLATNEVWLDPEKKRVEHTEWHNVIAWNKLADFVKQYVSKGQLIYLEGRIHSQSWIDKNEIRQKRVEIVCDTITPLEWKRSAK